MFGKKFGETECVTINDAKKIDFLKLCDIPNWEHIAFPIEWDSMPYVFLGQFSDPLVIFSLYRMLRPPFLFVSRIPLSIRL